MKNVNKTRNSNIELLRIFCMILLVAHHFSYHGSLYLSKVQFIRMFSLLFCPLGKICYDIFIVISCYYLVDLNWKCKRFFKIWLEVLFYNVVIDLIVVLFTGFNGIETIRMFIGGLFPMIGNSHGFASSYLTFIAVMPILKIIERNINQKQLKYFIAILFTVQIGSWVVEMITGFNAGIKSELFLFVFMYFLIYYLKVKNVIEYFGVNIFLRYIAIFVLIFIYVVEYIVWYISIENNSIIIKYMHNFISNQCSPLNIIAALTVFLLVITIPVKNISVVNKLAVGTFGVLLIHDHNYFRQLLWDNIVVKTNILNSENYLFLLEFIFVVICVYIICSVIDLLRQKFEYRILESKKINTYMNNIDNYIN